MSVRLMTAVWDSGRFESGTLLVMLALADWASDDGCRVFPKIAMVAKKARLSERQAQRCILRLCDDGALLRLAAATGRPGVAAEYRIVLDHLKPHDTGDSMSSKTGDTGSRLAGERGDIDDGGRVTPEAETGDIRDMTYIEEPSSKPSSNPPTRESSAGVRAREAPGLFGEESPKTITGEIVTFRNDVEQAMDAFNEIAAKFVKWRSCKLLVQKRTEAIRKTLREIGGLARWREALAMAEESEFLTSAPPRQGEHKNWRVSIEWFAKPQTVASILEGKYSLGNGRNLTLGGTTESMLEGLARGYQREMEG